MAAVAIFALHSWFFGYYIRHIDQAFMASWVWPFQGLMFYGVYAAAIFIGLCHWPLFAAITGTVGAVIFSEAFQSAAIAVHSSPRAHEMMSLVIGTEFTIFAGILVLCLAPPSKFAKRVWFLVIGLGILIGMNELSKLGIDIAAPSRG